MIPGFILGPRPGEFGVFIAPPGVDASTAPADALTLHVTSATAQIAMQGIAEGPFPRVIPHTLGYAPIIIPNLISTNLADGLFGYVRPFDNTYAPYTNSYVRSESNQFTFLQSGPLLSINYFVLNRRFP